MTDIKERLIRLGSSRPELRAHIRPVLAELEKTTALKNNMSHRDFLAQYINGMLEALASEFGAGRNSGLRAGQHLQGSVTVSEGELQAVIIIEWDWKGKGFNVDVEVREWDRLEQMFAIPVDQLSFHIPIVGKAWTTTPKEAIRPLRKIFL